MSADGLRDHAERFLAAATSHPECLSGRLVSADESGACIELDINVEMPTGMKVDGVSPDGVRRTETVAAKIWPRYPWSPPTFYLRNDFPRNLPHLQPGPITALPRPCLIDGHPREYFFQFGLVDAGVFHLIHQLVLWLQLAAIGSLIDPEQGWEPTLRRDLSDIVVVSAETARAMVNRTGGHRVLKAKYFRSGPDDAQIGGDALALIEISDTQVPLSRDDKKLFTWRGGDGSGWGNTVCCLVWPDKLPSGKVFIADSYMPETISTFGELIDRARELRCERALQVFLRSLKRCFEGYFLEPPIPIPIAIILCARRPFHLIGTESDIELLPYLLEIRAGPDRASLIAGGDQEPVAPALYQLALIRTHAPILAFRWR